MESIRNLRNTIENFLEEIADFFSNNTWINPFTIFLIILAFNLLIIFILIIFDSFKNRNNWKKKGYSSKKEYKEAQEDKALEFIGIDDKLTDIQYKYLDMLKSSWEADSTDQLEGTASRNFIDQTEINQSVLRKNNLDRDFDFKPNKQRTYYPSQIDYKSDGRILRHQIELAGSTSYTWKDLNSGKVLLRKKYDSSIIHFNTASGIYDSRGRAVCNNCGSSLEIENFDSYQCPYCGSIIYKSDYEDLLTSYSIIGLSKSQEEARKKAEIKDASYFNLSLLFTIPFILIGLLVLSIIIILAIRPSLYDSFSDLIGTFSIIFFPMLFIFILLNKDIRKTFNNLGLAIKDLIRSIARKETDKEVIEREEKENLSELISEDPEFSIDLANSQAIYMFKSLWLDEKRTKETWGVFTSPNHRLQLINKHKEDGKIVDLLVNEAVFNDYIKDDKGQKIRIYLSYDLLLLKSDSLLELENREYILNLVRNEDGTSVVLDGHSECPSCGSPIDISSMDSCSYCNTGLFRDSMMWRIDDLQDVDEIFRQKLEEKRKISPKASFRDILRNI